MIVGSNILAGASGQQGYFLNRSVRLRSSASANFSRTFATTTNRTTWTWSGWVKLGALSTDRFLFNNSNDGIRFYPGTDVLWTQLFSGTAYNLITTQVFRDPSAWYHIVWQIDTTQATATNRVRLYINGVQVTSFSTATYPPQNSTTTINTNTAHYIGSLQTIAGYYYDGYMTEVNFIDGQALTPSSFGAYNSYGVWSPAKYSGTYGTNGFYLNFQDNSAATAAAIGKDSSGNGNNWTPNNISVTAGVTYDSMTDVPTLTSVTQSNYAVMNPLKTGGITASNGNLTVTGNSSNTTTIVGTIGVSSGKWYWEFTVGSADQNSTIGICTDAITLSNYVGADANGWAYYGVNGNKYNAGTPAAYGASYTNGDVIGVALDLNAGTLTFYKNNTSQGTAYSGLASNVYFPAYGDSGTVAVPTGSFNFGQRPFAYTPPSGFVSLNTYNLTDSTISNGATQFAATLYTGTGSSLAISNAVNGISFQPDFVWVKGRSGATDHALYDSVRGTTKDLISNSTAAETTQATGLTAFGSTGFTVGSLAKMNTNTATYVGWQWKASNAAAVTNTSGTISSQVSANPSAGFSIVTYTGTGANATVGHGLGVAPKMVIVKPRQATVTSDNWEIYHASLGNTQFLTLNSTAAAVTASNRWNNTSPTSTLFTVGTAPSSNGVGYVAYCFAEVAGYSKAFVYTGNGSTDGVFSYLGFIPKMILLKRTDTTGNWYIWDTSRNTFNVFGEELYPNLSNAAATATDLDLLSNGFKLRNSTAGFNASGGTYIGFAWAENPFKNSLAR